MHSKIALSGLRRMTPYLITAGLGLSVAASAAQPVPSDDRPSEIPAPTVDTDGDGVMDAWDRDGDSQPDA